MLRNSWCAWATLVAMVACARQAVPRVVEKIDAKLDTRIQNYELDESSLPRALIVVAARFEIPMGIEWIEPGTPRPIRLSWKQATVRQIIHSIVRTQEGYDVQMGHMVHVFYRGAKNDKSNFLNIRLAQFEVKNQYIARALLNLHTEVNSRMTGAPLSHNFVGHYMLEPNDQRLNIEFKEATVRDILDRLVLLSGEPIWAVAFRPEAGLTAGGFRRTVSVVSSGAIPDNNQPALDQMMWGRTLPPPNWGPNANEDSAEQQ